MYYLRSPAAVQKSVKTFDSKSRRKAIGDYGAAFFNANATGNLSFLNNMVGICKVDRIEGGDDILIVELEYS